MVLHVDLQNVSNYCPYLFYHHLSRYMDDYMKPTFYILQFSCFIVISSCLIETSCFIITSTTLDHLSLFNGMGSSVFLSSVFLCPSIFSFDQILLFFPSEITLPVSSLFNFIFNVLYLFLGTSVSGLIQYLIFTYL